MLGTNSRVQYPLPKSIEVQRFILNNDILVGMMFRLEKVQLCPITGRSSITGRGESRVCQL